jgi:hypothetical protein
MSFDEMYDELVHAEFLSGAVNDPPRRRGAHAPLKATFAASRLRSIALVASGGLACAAAGAFLGGLGGEFAVTPAAAHALTNSHRSVSLAAAANSAFHLGNTAALAAPFRSAPVPGSVGNNAVQSGAPASGSTVGDGVPGGASSVQVPTTSGSTTTSTTTPGGGGTTPTTPTSPVTPVVTDVTDGLSGETTNLNQALNGIVNSLSTSGTGLSSGSLGSSGG